MQEFTRCSRAPRRRGPMPAAAAGRGFAIPSPTRPTFASTAGCLPRSRPRPTLPQTCLVLNDPLPRGIVSPEAATRDVLQPGRSALVFWRAPACGQEASQRRAPGKPATSLRKGRVHLLPCLPDRLRDGAGPDAGPMSRPAVVSVGPRQDHFHGQRGHFRGGFAPRLAASNRASDEPPARPRKPRAAPRPRGPRSRRVRDAPSPSANRAISRSLPYECQTSVESGRWSTPVGCAGWSSNPAVQEAWPPKIRLAGRAGLSGVRGRSLSTCPPCCRESAPTARWAICPSADGEPWPIARSGPRKVAASYGCCALFGESATLPPGMNRPADSGFHVAGPGPRTTRSRGGTPVWLR